MDKKEIKTLMMDQPVTIHYSIVSSFGFPSLPILS